MDTDILKQLNEIAELLKPISEKAQRELDKQDGKFANTHELLKHQQEILASKSKLQM